MAKRFNKSSHNTFHKTDGNKDIGNSFVNVVKGSGMSLETESTPMIVLDDECLNTKDLSCSLMGRVKEFTYLSNLKKVLCNEGFDVLNISYLVYWMRAKEVPGWTLEFTEEEEEDDVSVEDNHGGIHSDQEINNCNDESDVEKVPETCFNVPKGNLNEGHLDGGCAKKVNEQVAGDDNSFMHTVGGIKLMIVVVYAPQEASEKRMFWDYLTHVSDQWDGEIVMIGDFNEVRYKSKRFGSNFKAHDADIFNSFIHNAGLNKVHLGGSAFTWFHNSATKMINGFDKLVRDACNDATGNKKNAIHNFMYKLKYTKEKFRGWLSTYRLNSRGALAKLKEVLKMFDEAIDKGNSPFEMVHKRLETLNKIQQVNNTHMSEVAQKAKIKWVVEGDENTKFFHGMLNKKCNQRIIRGIMANGTWIDDPVKRDDLERMVIKEEVKKAVWDCGSDKFPGPDGFSFSFLRHFWSTIENDIFEAVDCFFTYEDMPNRCNSNFIALIPKMIDANMVKDFRPISLIGSLYKVIAKILTNLLVNVIGDLVNE
nr:RNA-directed DNA polymerase, eukaryota [Tanacetum cinerariifolium]